LPRPLAGGFRTAEATSSTQQNSAEKWSEHTLVPSGGGSMLHGFVAANREEIITRCRAKIAMRPVPRPTDLELQYGVPLFLTARRHIATRSGPESRNRRQRCETR